MALANVHPERFDFDNVAPFEMDRRGDLSLITSGLYLSSADTEEDLTLLSKNGITHILQVGSELEPTHTSTGRLVYKKVEIDDAEGEDLVVHLPACLEFIDEGRKAGGVLVHCMAGVSRSPSVVMAYLMARGGMALAAARSAVKAARPFIHPNQGFLTQLRLWGEAGCSAEGWQPWSLIRFLEATGGWAD